MAALQTITIISLVIVSVLGRYKPAERTGLPNDDILSAITVHNYWEDDDSSEELLHYYLAKQQSNQMNDNSKIATTVEKLERINEAQRSLKLIESILKRTALDEAIGLSRGEGKHDNQNKDNIIDELLLIVSQQLIAKDSVVDDKPADSMRDAQAGSVNGMDDAKFEDKQAVNDAGATNLRANVLLNELDQQHNQKPEIIANEQ
ncbi:hypothetical protein GJ496_006091 [Pomphorhynchus laevis]|nr:hypothetical protein GJ496_006091 [Pomphorhynchus laevis]